MKPLDKAYIFELLESLKRETAKDEPSQIYINEKLRKLNEQLKKEQ